MMDAELDPSIQFPHAVSSHALSPRAVLLTGATGLLGVYLLDELLRKTEATIYCLVRASDGGDAGRRVIAHLQSYGLWEEAFAGRIRAVAGDLTEPCFGLSDEEFGDLAAQTDVIYHSAGYLNMAFPYARLKPVNVTGTLEVLRLAGTARTKPVHFVSSMAVFFSEAHTSVDLLRETDVPIFHSSLKGGYSQSKWVADRLVDAARQRGLPACIYRPVRITGHSRTGAIHDFNDMLPLILKGCILLGKYPSFDIEITMVPVDYVSRAMVHLAGCTQSFGKDFHFFNPAPIEWSGLIQILRELGYPLQELPYDEWWRELKHAIHDARTAEHKSFLSRLLLALTAPHFLFYKRPPMDATHTREGLEGTGISCPPIDRQLMGTYLTYWRQSGYLAS